MSLILSKQSGRRSAVLTKLPNPKAGRNYSLTAVFDWKYYTRPGPLRQVKENLCVLACLFAGNMI